MKTFRKKFIIYMFAVLTIISLALSLTFVSKVEAVEEPIDTCTSGGKTTVNITTDIEEKLTDVHFIDNANYFKTNPKHADNKETDCPDGTCTTVAVQMLMGYHNYYTDRRLIPATDENGEAFLVNDYADLTQHPDVDMIETQGKDGLGRKETGTTDKFFYKLFALNPDAANSGGQTYAKVQAGAKAFVEQYASNIKENINFSWGLINKTEVKGELDKGNPVIVGRGQISERNFHVMVAYGYASYEGDDGFIVHCGWLYGDSYVWIPSSLLLFQMRMDVNTHTHNFVETGTYINSYYKEYDCTVCGANTFESIFTTSDSSITGTTGPFGQKNVVIPAKIVCGLAKGERKIVTITNIQAEAFLGTMSDDRVYNLTISEGIENIGNYAFKDCLSLKDVYLGKSVKNLGRRAFQNCNNIENITLSDSLLDLYTEDFIDLEKLKKIDVPYENSVYSGSNGVLYNKYKSVLIFYPAGKIDTSFSVDTDCRALSSNAFANNSSLQTLNLVNTKIIHSNSILNCSSLANIIAPKLEVAFSSAITGTKFTNERADITLGTVLLKKTSAGEIVEIADDVKTIAPGAFVGNESVKKLVVKNHSFREIGDNAFKDCSTLENVEIYNLNEVVRLGTGAFDGVSANLKIKVPQKYLNSYKTETTKGWTSFANILSTFDKLSVKYVVGDKVVKESFVDYGNEIGEDYKYIDGDYYAKTWKTADGTEIKGYYMVTEDIVLYGKLEPYNFTITYVTNGGKPITQGKYNVENDQKLIEAKRTGYTFEGWYTSPDLAEESKIDLVIKKGTRTGNLTVYAKWSVNTYTVAFDPGVDMSAITAQDVVFDEPFTFITISSSGRIFNGWKDENGRLLTNANGVGLGKWDIGESTTVYADWILIEYTITYPNADLPGNPDKFTIEDLPLVLVLTTDSQARNDGWYLNPEFTGVKVTEINEIGDITLYAKWAYCYNISYETLGGRYKDGVYPSHYYAYYGDSFTMPTIWREGFIDGVWTYDGREYPFGSKFTVYKNEERNDGIEFVVKWNPYYYKITFDFMGGTDGKNSKATREIMAAYYEIFPEIVLPVKAGYNFVGYGSSSYKLYYEVKDGQVVRKTNDHVGNMTLSAHWEVAYPKLTIDGKNGNTWSIRIQNTSSAKVTFDYNSKMLFEKDAKVWNVSDNDKKSVTIESNESAVVYISENWFATCIVVSMQLDDKRYITYAYNLDSNTKTLTPVNCYVSA